MIHEWLPFQSLFILQDRILGGLGDKSRRQAPFPTVNVLPAQTKMKLPPSLTKPAAATYRTPVPPSPSNFRYSTTTTVNPPPPPTVGGSKPLVQAQQNVVGQLAPVTQHQHVSGSIAGKVFLDYYFRDLFEA